MTLNGSLDTIRRLAFFQQNIRPYKKQVTDLTSRITEKDTEQDTLIESLHSMENNAMNNIQDDQEVTSADLYHLSLLHGACVNYTDAIVSWKFGAPGPHQDDEAYRLGTLVNEDDANLLEKLKQCPDVDLFLPSKLRGYGYCEDAMAYTKYLHTRVLPLWAVTKKMYDPESQRIVDYFDLCPKTPMLFFQHYWENIPSSSRWPRQKKMYLMPNIEMWELESSHYWRVDVVLCKTRICNERVTKWYEQRGNPNDAKVIYTKHTSSDHASYARRVLGNQVKAKNFTDVQFIHTAGGSIWKGTRQVIECWLSRPHFPPLDLYVRGDLYETMFKGAYDKRIVSSQIRLNTDNLNTSTFHKAVAQSAYFLCPSQLEGYGHYLNQARASGGVIVTTDLDPMKELIESDEIGLKVPARSMHDYDAFLGGMSSTKLGLRDEPGMMAIFTADELCVTVEHLLNDYTVDQRREMGKNAQLQYHKDTKFFELAMLRLRILARQHASAYSDNENGIDIFTSAPRRHIRDGATVR
uniref:Glycosyl transferase family 1 domain-containing protein n=1 Tax=Hyaloperonospora arabidopsidis (strain Emoy2) TaxID=559515 RepID=M4BGX8_HYAAE